MYKKISLSFLKELVQNIYDTFALALTHGSFWSTGIIDRNCSPQSCRLLAIHYGDAQRLNHDAEDFDQWSGLVDLCQSGTAVITFSMIPIARSRVSIAPTRSISSATKISAARPGRLTISQRALKWQCRGSRVQDCE